MLMKSRYTELLENTLTRYQRAGFLIGDYIKFVDKYQSVECYKCLSDTMKARIDDIASIAKDINVRIISIKNQYPTSQPGNEYNTNGNVVLDIAVDYGGGRYYGSTTIPSSIVSVIDYGINLAPLPDALTRDNLVTIKPEPVVLDSDSEMFKQTRKAVTGKDTDDTESNLNNVNVKLPSKGTAKYVKYIG
jgi:hypothetical protein